MTSGATAVQFAIIALTVGGLWVGARALVDSSVRIARRFGVSELTIGLTIVAMGTSTPELVVTVDAALWSGRRLSRSEGFLFVCTELTRWVLGLLRIFG